MMQPVPQQTLHCSPEEYLRLEEIAEYKNEYHDGEIFPMTGGTLKHNQIAGNFYVALKLALKGQDYRVMIGDVRLWIPPVQSFTYPDIMVIAGEPHYFENRQDTITNPLFITEILSQSTKNYDRGDKFEFYRTLPSFKEYILVSQVKIHVEQFTKTNENKWLLSEYDQWDAMIKLNTLPVTLALADIYDDIEFANAKV